MAKITALDGVFEEKCRVVLETAKQFLRLQPDWVSFFRETLGVNGIARQSFSTDEEILRFESTAEFQEIQKMVALLRHDGMKSKREPTRVITVRIPESLHEALKAECKDRETSMNKLCISKLLTGRADTETEDANSIIDEECQEFRRNFYRSKS